MRRMRIVDRFRYVKSKSYLDIEVRSDHLDKKSLKEHVYAMLNELQQDNEGFTIISFKYSNYLEITRHPLLAIYGIRFSGYLVRVVDNIDVFELNSIYASR